MRTIVVRLLMAACAWVALGQEFEVVSVKPNKSASTSSHSNSDRGRLTASNQSLRGMIMQAYGMRDYQVEGPEWLRSERFDVAAKFPEALPADREKYAAALQNMMRRMLEERFKLQVHRDEKIFPVYGLVVAKKGIRFKEVPDTGSHNSNSDNTHYEGRCISMAVFATFLSREVGQPVLDMTGLQGLYDLNLDWVREPRTTVDIKSEVPVAQDALPGTNIPTAIQDQLGLRLEGRKAPIEILIVDHIERVPTEN
jgi:uncharacterized protein (TIGR03435 family)